jgi:hypothetical protein
MQFDGIRRDARLTMAKVEEADTCEVHADLGALPEVGGLKARCERTAHSPDGPQKRARRSGTLGSRNLTDHGAAAGVAQDQVHVRVFLYRVPRTAAGWRRPPTRWSRPDAAGSARAGTPGPTERMWTMLVGTTSF